MSYWSAINSLSIMNNWFQKKEIRTSGYLDSSCNQEMSCDRLVVMRAEQRGVCQDVRVMRGANCWTDHMLVRAKLNVVVPRFTIRNVKPVCPLQSMSLALEREGRSIMSC